MANDNIEKKAYSSLCQEVVMDNAAEHGNIASHLQGVLRMYPGNGDASYAGNSARQRYVFHVLQPLFQEALEKVRFPKKGPLRIADLGCATGNNTISDVNFVVKTLKNMCEPNGSVPLEPEFQAFFSDLPSNDFNGLFNLLTQPNAPYYVAGVPGSFYNVLFPRSSIHISFSVMALHWLSEVPKAILQKDSPSYNRGRVWINGGRQDVVDLYSKQSQKDLTTFMKCRAQEMEPGGVLFLCLMGRTDSSPPDKQVPVGGEFCGQDFEDAWDDLVKQGIISSDLRDSFNLPWYFPNANELKQAVENCCAFEIETLQVCEGVPSMSEDEFEEWIKDPKLFAKMKSNLVKSFVGSLVEAHIGMECANLLFQTFEQRAAALLHCNPPSRFVTCTVASLVRK
eukprot:Gb_22487 [translate_table: standard]